MQGKKLTPKWVNISTRPQWTSHNVTSVGSEKDKSKFMQTFSDTKVTMLHIKKKFCPTYGFNLKLHNSQNIDSNVASS